MFCAKRAEDGSVESAPGASSSSPPAESFLIRRHPSFPVTDFPLCVYKLMMMMSDVDLLFLTFFFFYGFPFLGTFRPVNLRHLIRAPSVQRHSGRPPVVLDFASPLRSDQIAGTSRTSALLVPAPTGARLPHRAANLPARRHGPSQSIQVYLPKLLLNDSDLHVYILCSNFNFKQKQINKKQVHGRPIGVDYQREQ